MLGGIAVVVFFIGAAIWAILDELPTPDREEYTYEDPAKLLAEFGEELDPEWSNYDWTLRGPGLHRKPDTE